MTERQMNEVEKKARDWLVERGVTIDDIAELVYFLQVKYHPDLQLEVCKDNVDKVLRKREVQNAIITGIQLDVLAEKKLLEDPLQGIIDRDEGLYG
ncbi:low temperature requirement C protein [Halalkalibacter akibai JCM 9157]|uniref:Low temperature requirement C protein n=1 Tax=Halalkalibacter akibai (strain ATCC 43226 / DSM 21942 / CIP 109018 / JCM 9157 / 1139) TaxID=1236973 RepID=W4QPK2_HALA3|nr:low temperature requirement C protein [Halalkalibacter akibai JCM 9157]